MKVLLVDDLLDIGGKERQMLTAVKVLRSRGVEVHLGLLSKPGTLGAEAAVLADSCVIFGRKHPFSPGVIRRLRKYIRESHFDIVHCNGVIDSIYVYLASLGLPVQCVCTVHGYEKGLYLTVHRWVLARFDAVIAVSNTFLQDMKKLGYTSPIFRVINNSISDDYQPAGRQDNHAGSTTVKAVMVSRFDWSKDQMTVARAMALLMERGVDISLDFIGTGPDEYISPVREFITSHGLQEMIHFLGEINDLTRVLPAYDLIVMSSNAESFGIALVEGMASGLPVVASDIPSFREIISDTKFGMLFEPGDDEGLADRISALISSPARMRELSVLSLERAVEYSPDRFAEDTLDLYNTLTGKES
jgi:glycosyltransferase involved in cell wall biosynthesis